MIENKNIKRLITLAIAATMCLVIVPTVNADCPDGIVAYLKFDEDIGSTAYDETTYDNDGTINGATWVDGIVNKALEFDGVDDNVDVPSSTSLDITSDLTMEAWIEPDSVYYTAQGEIIGKWVAGDASYYFAIHDGELQMRISLTGGDYYNIEETSNANLDIDTWYHVVGVYDASEEDIMLYINGVEESTTVAGIIPPSIHSSSVNVKIGGWYPGYYFDGKIDEVAIYDTVLSASEISSHYYAGLAGHGYCDCPDTVYVDVGFNPSTSGWMYDHFDTIQDGVDAVCDGGTVYVYDGNYNAVSSPFVRITKSLTLDGESRDGVILDGTGTSTIPWAKGIHVTANDVTIKDLTVQNFGAVNYWGYGVVFRDYAHDTSGEGFIYYNGCTVENVKSQDNCYPMYAFCFTHLTVSDCLIQNNLGDGMFIAKGSSDATITGNTVLNSGDHGIWVGGAGWCGPSCPNAIITNNYVDGAREGGISFVSSDTALISDNIVTNAKGQFPGAGWSVGAISLKDGCSNVVIRDNLIYENDIVDPLTDSGRGIGIDGTSFNIDILCNTIRDNDGDGVWVSGTITGFQCNCNDIYGNAGYGANNIAGTALDFECNWWGAHDGPSGNGPGTGDAVSTNVDFDPWIGITDLSGPTDPVQLGDPANIGFSFTCNKGTATLDWGDGTQFTYSAESVTTTESHTYSAVGVYTVTLTIEDCCGRSYSREFRYVVVYDPDDGFVTGGGWIMSPEGAYPADPDLTGKANFGFVSKYKKGQSTPTGNTEFKFELANLDFHSSSYDWLVITGGNKAMYKGTGTINDAGSYKFMLTAYDDNTDTFRIRIWEEDEFGNETTIYDNGTDTVLGGGQIKIH